MKIIRFVAVMLSLTFLPALAFSEDLGRARIGLVEGDVQVNTEETGEWFPVSVNTPLREGDRLWVPGEGRSEIQVLGGVFIRLDAGTSFDILSLGETSLQFYMEEGRAYLNNRENGINHIQVDSPFSSISCYDNAVVMIDVTENGATELSVLRGHAFAETRNGKMRVAAGNTLRIDTDLRADMYPLRSPDDWEQWNRERDRWLADSRGSERYLPDELDDYVSDFDANGKWFNTADYGYVWTPSIAISVNWAPYRTGRWVWFGGHYVWISYEPWGWVPYHYGRWAFLPRAGWCWVPPRRGAVHWAPGYVAWVHTSSYVSWVPLAPGDIYYGFGNYGPGSVNINNITINNRFNRNFRNINVRNAVTVMHRDSFIHGRKADFRLNENPFKRNDVGIGPPRFKPDKTAMSPVIRKIPVAKLPPQQVRKFNPDLIRKERRLVRDERGSVFNPGRPVKEMTAIRREAPKRLRQERRPERGDMQQLQRKEDTARKERQMRQREIIGPIGIDRPENGTERAPAVTPQSQRRPMTQNPAAEPRSGGTRDDIRRQTPSATTVTPSAELPGGSLPVTPRTEQRPRAYAPKRAETPTAPQTVAPTPVWRAPQSQQPRGQYPGERQQRMQQPQVRQPAVNQERYQQKATPVAPRPVYPSHQSYQPRGETSRIEGPPVQRQQREQQPQVRQPAVIQEKIRQEAAPAAKPDDRQPAGPPEGTLYRPSYQEGRGERGNRNR